MKIEQKQKIDVLYDFLKLGLPFRKIDTNLGLDYKKSRGWGSYKIIKGHNLTIRNQGALFVYTETQAKKLISEFISENSAFSIRQLIKNNPPDTLSDYDEDSYILTKNSKSLYGIMNGETRNIVQSFFKPQKDFIAVCQQKGCTRRITSYTLYTAHLQKERPQLFMEAADASFPKRVKDENSKIMLKKFKIRLVMKLYLERHKGETIAFLCKKHHNALDGLRPKKLKDKKKQSMRLKNMADFNNYIKRNIDHNKYLDSNNRIVKSLK